MTRSFDLMITVNTARCPILVVGGGPVGERKVGTLLDAGVDVILVSPDATPCLRELAGTGRIDWKARKALQEDFLPGGLAVLAVPEGPTEGLLTWAREAGTLCNCCSLSEEGDWALAAQFDRDGLRFGVATGGKDPSRAARWKKKLMKMIEEANP